MCISVCIPVEMQPLVVSPRAWIWKPWRPGESPVIFPFTWVDPVCMYVCISSIHFNLSGLYVCIYIQRHRYWDRSRKGDNKKISKHKKVYQRSPEQTEGTHRRWCCRRWLPLLLYSPFYFLCLRPSSFYPRILCTPNLIFVNQIISTSFSFFFVF